MEENLLAVGIMLFSAVISLCCGRAENCEETTDER